MYVHDGFVRVRGLHSKTNARTEEEVEEEETEEPKKKRHCVM